MRIVFILFFCLFLLLICHDSRALITTPPLNPTDSTQPVPVFIAMQFVLMSNVDATQNSYDADFYLKSYWMAPKSDVIFSNITGLADPASANASSISSDSDLNSAELFDNYWNPQLDFVNTIGGIIRLQDNAYGFAEASDISFTPQNGGFGELDPSAYVLPDGWIWCYEDQRFLGVFATPLNMRAFPFDTQQLMMRVESYWDATQVKFVIAEPSKFNLANLFPPGIPNILGWLSFLARSVLSCPLSPLPTPYTYTLTLHIGT